MVRLLPLLALAAGCNGIVYTCAPEGVLTFTTPEGDTDRVELATCAIDFHHGGRGWNPQRVPTRMRLDAQGPTDGGGEAAVQILADLPFDPDHITHTVDAPERGSYYARLDDALRIPAGAGGWDGGEGRATFNTGYLPPGGEDWVVWQAASGTLDITRPPGFPQGGGETEEYLVASSPLPGVEGGRAELSLVATTVARVSDEFVSQGVEWTGR